MTRVINQTFSATFALFLLCSGTTLAQVEEPLTWVTQETKRQLAGCKVKSHSGIEILTPDGIAHYKALWTRDFYYYYAGELLEPAHAKSLIEYTLSGQRADGCMPDRVQINGTPIYSPGGEHKPLADHALDNAPFIALSLCEYAKRTDDMAFFLKHENALKKGLDHIHRAENGLVYNPKDKPQCVYGFTDIVIKTGHLLFTSLLYHNACIKMDQLQKMSKSTAGVNYLKRAALIKNNINILWNEETGMFHAADLDCKQIDIWGSAYAVEIGLASEKQADRISEYIVKNWDGLVQCGQVRHLPAGEGWERLFIDWHPIGSYINGAFWSTPLPWLAPVVARKSPEKARQMILDTVADFQQNKVAECINGDQRKVLEYVPSITNLYGATKWLAQQ